MNNRLQTRSNDRGIKIAGLSWKGWIVGGLSMMPLLGVATSVQAAIIGPATGYNLFVQEDILQDTIHAQGKVAVGGDITATVSYGIGDRVGTGDVLVVGGDVNLGRNGQVNGRVVYGGSASVNATEGTLQGNPLDFASAFADLANLSAGFIPNGTASAPDTGGNITLTGTDPDVNVFAIHASALTRVVRYQLDTPDSSHTVINVWGDNLTLGNGNFEFQVSDEQAQRLVYNFPVARTLTAQAIGFRGNVLAPLAQFNGDNGQILGTGVFRSVREIPNVGGVFEYNQPDVPTEIVSNDVPSTPTPALLPGIGAMLLQCWRRRRKVSSAKSI